MVRKDFSNRPFQAVNHEEFRFRDRRPEFEMSLPPAMEVVAPCGARGCFSSAVGPASTAGVERVFSAAGKMHSDLRKSMQDSTLEHSLFAAFNSP